MEEPGHGLAWWAAVGTAQHAAAQLCQCHGVRQSPGETLSPNLTGWLPPTTAPCPPTGPQAGGGRGWDPSSLLLCRGWPGYKGKRKKFINFFFIMQLSNSTYTKI